VLIADNDKALRSNLRSLLRHENARVVAEVGTSRRAIVEAGLRKPDLILMDFALLEATAPEIVGLVGKVSPKTEITFITLHDESIYADLTQVMHVRGFIAKQSLNSELPRVLQNLRKIKYAPRSMVD
jgi:DNA-binding NarL/FixJ family response regulator